MSNKLQIRRGLASQRPTLDIGELGYDSDTGNVVVGNATSVPVFLTSSNNQAILTNKIIQGQVVISSGAANTYNVTITNSALGSYQNGMQFEWIAHQNNTSAAQFNINGLGSVSILDSNGNSLSGGEILNGSLIHVEYYGGAVRLLAANKLGTLFVGGTSSGTASAQILTVVPSYFTLTSNYRILFTCGISTTGATTATINGLTATAIKKRSPSGLIDLVANDMVLNQIYELVYDGTYFELMNSTTGNVSLMNQGTSIANSGSGALELFLTKVTTPSNNYAILNADGRKLYNYTAGNATYTLPDATVVGNGWWIGIAASIGNISTINTTSSQSIHSESESVTTMSFNSGATGYSFGIFKSNGTDWDIIAGTPSVIKTGKPVLSFNNLVVTVTAVAAASITADLLTVKNASGGILRLSSVSVTLNTATSGAGGLDTGSLAASTLYALYVIYNPSTATANSLISLSATAPTLPSGYTLFMRVGWLNTDGSSNLYKILQNNRKVQYIVQGTLSPTSLISLGSGTSGSVSVPTWTALTYSAKLVPPSATEILGVISCQSGSSGIMVSPNANYGNITSTSNPPPVSLQSVGTQQFNFVLESSTISWASSGSSNSIYLMGYIDNL